MGLAFTVTISEYSAACSIVQGLELTSPKDISEATRPDGSCLFNSTTGPAAHVAPSILAESLGPAPYPYCAMADQHSAPASALAYQLPRNYGSYSGAQGLPVNSEKAPCPGPFRQHDSGGQHKPPRGTQDAPSVQSGEGSPSVGTTKPLFGEGSAPSCLSKKYRYIGIFMPSLYTK